MDMMAIQEWYDNNYITYGLFAIAAYGILIKCIVGLIYKGLLKASDAMGASGNKLMKLLRMKFETCYKLKIGVKNVDSFVDKYIYKYRFMGILLYTWESIGGQVLIISMLAGTVAVVTAIVIQCGQAAMLSTLLASICACALLVTAESMLNLPMKRKVLRVNIIDYLDNFLKARLENEYLHPEELDAYCKAYFTEKPDEAKEGKPSGEEKGNFVPGESVSEVATALDEGTDAGAEIDEGLVELMNSILDGEMPGQTADKKESPGEAEGKEQSVAEPAAEGTEIVTQAYDLELERLRRQRQENEKLIHAIDNAIANRSRQLQRENVSEKESRKKHSQEEKIIEEVLKEYLG